MLIKKICILICLFLPFISFTQEQTDSISIQKILDEVNVNSIRANEKTPVAFTNIGKAEIEKGNLGQDLPYIIKTI